MDFWNFLANRKIGEAQQRGEFDQPGERSVPLDLTENPYVPEEKRLAFKLLKDNDLVPAWIADGKDIRRDSEQAIRALEQAHQRFRSTLRKLDARVDVEAIYERDAAYRAWDSACAHFRSATVTINKAIHLYNLKVPISDLQRLYLNAEREIERIEARTKRGG